MDSVPVRGPAPWADQVAALALALVAFFAIGILVTIAQGLIHVGLTAIPVAPIIACLVTIRARSLWPVVTLVALAFGFLLYVIILNAGGDSRGTAILIRLEVSWAISLTVELAVGALAGWLWYRREASLARPPASA